MKKERKFKINPLACVLGTILIAYTLVLFFILFYGFFNSLKEMNAFAADPVFLSSKIFDDLAVRKQNNSGAKIFDFANYSTALTAISMIDKDMWLIEFPELLLNSLLYSCGCAFFATITPCLVAYVTTKYNFRFNGVVYMIVIFVMVTPIVGTLPTQIKMSRTLGLFDSHVGLWFMSATFLGTYYLVFYGIFKGLSWEYAEAALMDGASHWTVMVKVMLPLVKNTILVVFLLQFISYWNDYQRSWIFLPNHPTLSVAIQYSARGGTDNANAISIPVKLASGMLLMLPVLVLFLIFRDKFVGNLTVGGIKG